MIVFNTLTEGKYLSRADRFLCVNKAFEALNDEAMNLFTEITTFFIRPQHPPTTKKK